MPNKEWVSKFKAALEYEECINLDLAADISQNLDCYDFYFSLTSPEEYGRALITGSGYMNSLEPVLCCFDFEEYGRDQIAAGGAVTTEYGMIARNEKEFCFDYYTPPSTQQQLI